MPHWVAVHIAGRYDSVDVELVRDIRSVDPQDPTRHGSILTLHDGTELQVDEAPSVMRILLARIT